MNMPATLTPARCTARTARAAHNDDAELWTRAEVEAMLAAQAAGPADPMDWQLPCDVKVGHGTHGKGTPLRTLVKRMQLLYDMAQQSASASMRAEPVTAAYGQVWRNGALVMCEQFDREPCPHQPHRRCGDCPARLA